MAGGMSKTKFDRPAGTDSAFHAPPAVETAGYFQMFLWNNDSGT
jgi:hypothetical protein